jgi:hypothetical protein
MPSLVVVNGGDEGGGGRRWWVWSSGLSCGASTSSVASRSSSSRGRRGCRATRSGGRCAAIGRRSISGHRSHGCSIRSRMRSTGCCARTPSCLGCACASCWRRWAARLARRSLMTICARCGRCSCRRRGPFSGRSIGRARSSSSTSGSRCANCGSGMARRAAALSCSPAWATRARAPACWVLDTDRGHAGRDRRLP